jgi:hypothetical protein
MTTQTPGDAARLYERRLPSGGYVAIDVLPVRALFGPTKMRGHLVVERRPEERRLGHRAPIAACAEQGGENEIIAALLPIANSDDAIAEVLARKVMVTITAGRKREPDVS